MASDDAETRGSDNDCPPTSPRFVLIMASLASSSSIRLRAVEGQSAPSQVWPYSRQGGSMRDL
eukprot:342063-Lingulodinium_polyedra.AAC.1